MTDPVVVPAGMEPRGRLAALRGRLALLLRSPRLLLPLLLRGLIEGLIRLTRGGRRTFHDPAAHPWTRQLEAGWAAAKSELLAVLERREAIPPFQEVQPEQASLTTDGRWRTYVLYGYGEWVARNRRECPRLAALLERVPGLQAAMISILEPGKRLAPHRGPYAGVLRYHLGLLVPEPAACGIRVGRDVRGWTEGASLLFDDSFDHAAWNDGTTSRAVLFLDVERPLPGLLGWLNRRVLRSIARSRFARQGQENLARWYAALEEPERVLERAAA